MEYSKNTPPSQFTTLGHVQAVAPDRPHQAEFTGSDHPDPSHDRLRGTSKQVEWADRIREDFLRRVESDQTLDPQDLYNVREVFLSVVDSTWFIASARNRWTVAQMLGEKHPRPDQCDPKGGGR